jgi:hypothetical protein
LKNPYSKIFDNLVEALDDLHPKAVGVVTHCCGKRVPFEDCELVDNDNMIMCKKCYKEGKEK